MIIIVSDGAETRMSAKRNPAEEARSIGLDGRCYWCRRNILGGQVHSATASGSVNFIMLNPSTADETTDDPTIRKCVGFAKRWGFERLTVTNLFAYRATNPRDLVRVAEYDLTRAIGPDNDRKICQEAASADAVVCAWGDKIFGDRDMQVLSLLDGYELLCIGLTANGNPLHPSRAAYTQAPQSFPQRVLNAALALRTVQP